MSERTRTRTQFGRQKSSSSVDQGSDNNSMGDEEEVFMMENHDSDARNTETGVVVGEEEEEDDPNVLKILVSTDNHLGYMERDPVRGMDSFAAFEEVMILAKVKRCDMVLLAGDLFHDNKPSRRTLYRTMQILRRYCMGPNPVKFQIVSSYSSGAGAFRSSSVNQCVNYEDEYFSVDLPVFSIHGNHDDPTRDAVAGGRKSDTEPLAALDLLAVANLVNYFGRSDEVDKVQVNPILIRKGTSSVALYGLGSLRDERLNRMWQNNKVRFIRPNPSQSSNDEASVEDADDWFNLFAIHQNRDYGRGVKNCIKEDMIPEWMDLVVWGHEHECLINLSESLIGTFRITQPGSSVATSLSPGETVTKRVGLLEIRNKQFRLMPIPLKQVRSFVMGEISLSNPQDEAEALDPDDPNIEQEISNLLIRKVEALVKEAREKTVELHQEAVETRNDDRLLNELERQAMFTVNKPDLVLVRLKVEHHGFSSLNNQRFGSRFVNDVANLSDILLFHRKRGITADKASLSKDARNKLSMPLAPEELENTNVEDLINDDIEQGSKQLELFQLSTMGNALTEFVDKQSTLVFDEMTSLALKNQQKKLIKRGNATGSLDTKITTAAGVREVCQYESKLYHQSEQSTREDVIDTTSDTVKQGKPHTQSQSATALLRKTKDSRTEKPNIDVSVDSDSQDDDNVKLNSRKQSRKRPISETIVNNTASKTTSIRSIKATTKYIYDSNSEEDEPPRKKLSTKQKSRISRSKAYYESDSIEGIDDDYAEGTFENDRLNSTVDKNKQKSSSNSTSKQMKQGKLTFQSQISFTSAAKKAKAPSGSYFAKKLSEYQLDSDDDDSKGSDMNDSIADSDFASTFGPVSSSTNANKKGSGRRSRTRV